MCVGPELINYYAGYDAHTFFQFQGLVFGPGDDEPTFVMRDVDIGRAEVTSWVSDVRLYRHGAEDPVEMVAKAVKERLGSSTRVGADLQAYAFTGIHALRLKEALGSASLENFTNGLDGVRLSKSDEEMNYVRKAAAIATAGLERANATARPGITEIDLAAEIEAAMRQAGSEYPGMPTWISSGARRIGHKTADRRVIESGGPDFDGVSRRLPTLSRCHDADHFCGRADARVPRGLRDRVEGLDGPGARRSPLGDGCRMRSRVRWTRLSQTGSTPRSGRGSATA